MFRSHHREGAAHACATRIIGRFVLAVSSVVLALSFLAVPAHADPGRPLDHPTGGSSADAPGRTGGAPPAPDHASAPDAVGQPQAAAHAAPPAPAPPASAAPASGVPAAHVPAAHVPAADVPAADIQAPAAAAPAQAKGAKGHKVVVCKYVRKPGVAEIFSHIIVVNENALLGKGFAGTFPFAFSDAHFKSVAIRYAARGEQAREVSPTECPADQPPGEEPPGEEPPGEPPAGEVGGISEDADTPAVSDGMAIPNTGAPANLQLLALLGGLCSLGGVWLVARGGRCPQRT